MWTKHYCQSWLFKKYEVTANYRWSYKRGTSVKNTSKGRITLQYRWFLKRMTVKVRSHCISVELFGLAQSHLDCLCFSVSFLFHCFITWFWSRHVLKHVANVYSLLLVAMPTVVTMVIVVALSSLISLLAKIQSNFYLSIYKKKYIIYWNIYNIF